MKGGLWFTRRQIEGLLDTLNRVGCHFWACPGPNKKPRAMLTCCRCREIWNLNRRLARLEVKA